MESYSHATRIILWKKTSRSHFDEMTVLHDIVQDVQRGAVQTI